MKAGSQTAGHQFEEETLMGMFAPDFALPAQMATRSAGAPWVFRLIERFLWRNIADYIEVRIRANSSGANFARDRRHQRRQHVKHGRMDDAKDWFHDRERNEPFSYLWTCDALGLDPEWLFAELDKVKTNPGLARQIGRMVA